MPRVNHPPALKPPRRHSRRQPADWEAIKRDFLAGQLSLREIGTLYDVSHTAIAKKAKELGWNRNLTERVVAEAEAILSGVPGPNLVATVISGNKTQESVAIQSAAQERVVLVMSHRSRIGRAVEIVETLLDQLGSALIYREEIEHEIEAANPDKKDYKRRVSMLGAVSLPAHAAAADRLASALNRLIPLQRQAFGMDTGKDEKPPTDPKVAEMRAQARQKLLNYLSDSARPAKVIGQDGKDA